MQRFKEKRGATGQDEASERKSRERPKAFDEEQGEGGIPHEKVQRPDGSFHCGICGAPWPCIGAGAFPELND